MFDKSTYAGRKEYNVSAKLFSKENYLAVQLVIHCTCFCLFLLGASFASGVCSCVNLNCQHLKQISYSSKSKGHWEYLVQVNVQTLMIHPVWEVY